MGAQSIKGRVQGVSALIEYGFSQYETATVLGPTVAAESLVLFKGEVSSAEVGSSQSISVVIPKGQRAALQLSYDLPDKLVAPLTVTDVVGTANISYNGTAVGQVELHPLQDYALGSIWVQMIDAVKIKLF
jgi:D-alanyl-D-alanine carboxypeptidase (penicillin-binding protein 5/6)